MYTVQPEPQNDALLALAAEIGSALTEHDTISEMLQVSAAAVVRHLHAVFARIWLLNESTQTLELIASAGKYTNIDGSHARIKVGELKIGRIAQSRRPHITNDVANDPHISDPAWAAREGLISFAGYPLLIDEELVGVMCYFASHALHDDTFTALAAVANSIAIGIKRKSTEEQLLVSERKYRAVFDTAPDGILTVNDAGLVESANRAAHEMFGLADGKLIGEKVVDVMPDFFGMDPNKFEEQRLTTGEKRIFGSEREVRAQHNDGYQFPVELSLSVTNLGRTSIFTAIIRDITERKAIENELRERESIFNRFASSVRDIFWISSPDLTKHYYVSPAFEEIWGRPVQELYTIPDTFLKDIVAEDHQIVAEWQAAWARTHSTTLLPFESPASEVEFRVIRPDGSIRWLWVRSFPVYDAAGKIVQVCGLTHDNTERREAQKRVSEFYSMVSHELRTPLTSVRAALGLIEGGLTGGASEETMELIRIARSESDRLIRLVNDILDMRKMEAGKLELNMVALTAADVLSSAIDSMRGFAQENNIELASFIDEPREFLGDRDRVLQVLTNLLSNAIKFSPAGSTVEMRVIGSTSQNSMVRFCVIDHGPGIPSNKMDKLFGLFQQLDSSDTRARGGTGLGLAISKAIVERLGGAIGIDSTVGIGSTFWFEVPAIKSMCPLSAHAPTEGEQHTINEFLAEYAKSLPGWLEELSDWLKDAREKKERKLMTSCLLRVRKIRGSAEPCGFPDIAEKMRSLEFALSNIIENSSKNIERDWQSIESDISCARNSAEH